MKKLKFAIKLILFITVFALLFVCVSYILRPESDMKTRFAGFYAEPKDTVDVVVIGSSQIAPLVAAPLIWNEYGITVYPLSTNAQPAAGIKYLIEETQKRQEDCLYVVDVSMFMMEQEQLLTEPRIRNLVDNMKYSVNRIRAINELVSKPEERLNYYFDISKYHTVLTTGETGSLKYFDFSVPSEYKGYLFVDAVQKFETEDVLGVTQTKAVPESGEQELLELLEYCSVNELDVLFVISPYVVSEERKMNHNYLEGIIEDNGYDFIDYNDLIVKIGIDFGTDLYNKNHLNLRGAEKFSMYFGDYIKRTYEFDDKRGDKGYSAWDESYSVWVEEAEIIYLNIEDNLSKLN